MSASEQPSAFDQLKALENAGPIIEKTFEPFSSEPDDRSFREAIDTPAFRDRLGLPEGAPITNVAIRGKYLFVGVEQQFHEPPEAPVKHCGCYGCCVARGEI